MVKSRYSIPSTKVETLQRIASKKTCGEWRGCSQQDGNHRKAGTSWIVQPRLVQNEPQKIGCLYLHQSWLTYYFESLAVTRLLNVCFLTELQFIYIYINLNYRYLKSNFSMSTVSVYNIYIYNMHVLLFPWNFSQSKRPINYRLRNETWPNRMSDYKTWAYGSCGYEGTQYIRNAGRTYLLNNQNPSNQPILHPSNLYCIHPTYNL